MNSNGCKTKTYTKIFVHIPNTKKLNTNIHENLFFCV